jgi:hypothetical protein
VIVAGAADKDPELTLRPFGIELLERIGDDSLDNNLAFLRVITQFRGFAPKLMRGDRIRTVMELLFRTSTERGPITVCATCEMAPIYVADW